MTDGDPRLKEAAPDRALKGQRSAVVVVHGIGEQRPMTTLRGFLRGLWPTRTLFTVPDWADISFELSTFIVPKDATDSGKQIDFYEGYWAPDARGTRLSHVTSWARQLFLRTPGSLPSRLRVVWCAASVLVVVAAVLVGTGIYERITSSDVWWVTALRALGAAAAGAVAGWLTSGLGDAARYLDAKPANVEMRRTIRNRMVELLDYFHTSGRYERVVVVGHSLGAVIAYDAVRLLWQRRVSRERFAGDESDLVEAATRLLESRGDRAELARKDFTGAQLRLCRQLGDDPKLEGRDPEGAPSYAPRWLISDLVTVGAPVAHATLLMAGKEGAFRDQIEERSLPTCPPQWADPSSFCFESDDGKRIHHGAVFAAVRWTNVYAAGDFVGGPINPVGELNGGLGPDAGLGIGVVNYEVTEPRYMRRPWSHTRYWKSEEGEGTSWSYLRSVLPS